MWCWSTLSTSPSHQIQNVESFLITFVLFLSAGSVRRQVTSTRWWWKTEKGHENVSGKLLCHNCQYSFNPRNKKFTNSAVPYLLHCRFVDACSTVNVLGKSADTSKVVDMFFSLFFSLVCDVMWMIKFTLHYVVKHVKSIVCFAKMRTGGSVGWCCRLPCGRSCIRLWPNQHSGS